MRQQEPDETEGSHTRRGALIGLVVILALVLGGLLLTDVLRRASQMQDCVMSGRTNCAPIETSRPRVDDSTPPEEAAPDPAATPAQEDPDCGRRCNRSRERPQY